MSAIELSEIGLFRGMKRDTLSAALDHPLCTRIRYKRDDTIYSPSAFRRSLGVLRSGRIRVTKGELTVSVLEAGDIFGAAALFNESVDYATTLTADAACDIVFFSQELVEELLEQCPAFMKNYVRYLSERIHFLSARLDTLAAGTAEEKVAQYLLCNMDEQRMVHISATALTNRLNISRATLYRVFEAMETEGAIKRGNKIIKILDLQRLRK